MPGEFFAHPTAIIDTPNIGKKTRVWEFVHILENVVIGEDCNICSHCFIENGVVIGNRVTVKSGIYIWTGVTIEDDVLLGPNVTFTNDVRPRSKQYEPFENTLLKKGASIGGGSSILAGVTIGRYAMTGIGSVIVRNVPDYALVYGNPAMQHGWVDEKGRALKSHED